MSYLEGFRYPIKTTGAKSNWIDEKEPLLSHANFEVVLKASHEVKGDSYASHPPITRPAGCRYYGSPIHKNDERSMLLSRGRIFLEEPAASSNKPTQPTPEVEVVKEVIALEEHKESDGWGRTTARIEVIEDEEDLPHHPVADYIWNLKVEIFTEAIKHTSFPTFMLSRWEAGPEMPASVSTIERPISAYISTPFCPDRFKGLAPVFDFNRYLEKNSQRIHNQAEVIEFVTNFTASRGHQLITALNTGVNYSADYPGKVDVSLMTPPQSDLTSLDRVQFTFDDVMKKRLNQPYPSHLLFLEDLESFNGFTAYDQGVSQFCRVFKDEQSKYWFWNLKTRSWVAVRTNKMNYQLGWHLHTAASKLLPDEHQVPSNHAVSLQSTDITNVLHLPYCQKQESVPSFYKSQRRGKSPRRTQQRLPPPSSSPPPSGLQAMSDVDDNKDAGDEDTKRQRTSPQS